MPNQVTNLQGGRSGTQEMELLSDMGDIMSYGDVLACVSSALAARSATQFEKQASIQTPTSRDQETDRNEVPSDNNKISSDDIRIQYDREKLEVEIEWEAEENSEQYSKEDSINPVKLSTCFNAVSFILKLKHMARSKNI